VNEDLYSPDDVTQMFKADLNAAGPSIIDESEDVKVCAILLLLNMVHVDL
jgi:hypothetical protein